MQSKGCGAAGLEAGQGATHARHSSGQLRRIDKRSCRAGTTEARHQWLVRRFVRGHSEQVMHACSVHARMCPDWDASAQLSALSKSILTTLADAIHVRPGTSISRKKSHNAVMFDD